MKQLQKQDPIAMGMLGKQAIREQSYRPLTYVLTTNEAERKILFNMLTHEMIAVKLSELELPETRKYLIENWYLVPTEHDDQQLVDECRAVLTLMDSWPKKIHSFYIFTTLDCNARCFYCFEKRMAGSDMTIETASRASEYIQEQAGEELIKLMWFGGEPLFNYSVIDFITRELKEKNLQFESNMISNGLLFDSKLVERAKNLWNLKNVQITLDGTRQIYKRVKAYVTDIKDPFERVLQNIKMLLKAGIGVKIRLNIGLHNYADMQELVDFLCTEFENQDNLYVYVTPLYEISKYTKDKRECIYDILDDLSRKLNQAFGKKEKKSFFDQIANGSCMASGREAVTILPDGKVGICPDLADDVLLGDVYTKKLDVGVRERFGRRFYREDKCSTCPLYPNCYIVNGCPHKDAEEGCDSVKVQREIKKVTEKMKVRCRMVINKDSTESFCC